MTRELPKHVRRQLLERSGDLYLRSCYARRTAARVEEYAQHLELTRQHLARRVLDAAGMTPSDFLRSRQLLYAERLLRTTSYSTAEIAAMAAFGTSPTFYRAFKTAYGMTPGEYRKQVPK